MSRLARFVTADGLSAVLPVSGDLRPTICRAVNVSPPLRLIRWTNAADALAARLPIRTYEYHGTEHDPERGELLIYRERYDAGGSR